MFQVFAIGDLAAFPVALYHTRAEAVERARTLAYRTGRAELQDLLLHGTRVCGRAMGRFIGASVFPLDSTGLATERLKFLHRDEQRRLIGSSQPEAP